MNRIARRACPPGLLLSRAPLTAVWGVLLLVGSAEPSCVQAQTNNANQIGNAIGSFLNRAMKPASQPSTTSPLTSGNAAPASNPAAPVNQPAAAPAAAASANAPEPSATVQTPAPPAAPSKSADQRVAEAISMYKVHTSSEAVASATAFVVEIQGKSKDEYKTFISVRDFLSEIWKFSTSAPMRQSMQKCVSVVTASIEEYGNKQLAAADNFGTTSEVQAHRTQANKILAAVPISSRAVCVTRARIVLARIAGADWSSDLDAVLATSKDLSPAGKKQVQYYLELSTTDFSTQAPWKATSQLISLTEDDPSKRRALAGAVEAVQIQQFEGEVNGTAIWIGMPNWVQQAAFDSAVHMPCSGVKGSPITCERFSDEQVGTPAAAASPSFDCARATTSIEKMICSNSQLAKADSDLAGFYARNIAAAGAKSEMVRQGQRAFITARNQCSDAPCIKEAYRARWEEIAQLGFVRE